MGSTVIIDKETAQCKGSHTLKAACDLFVYRYSTQTQEGKTALARATQLGHHKIVLLLKVTLVIGNNRNFFYFSIPTAIVIASIRLTSSVPAVNIVRPLATASDYI